ncbi:MAG: hypothetical protein O3B13_24245 [Planctomycetota bacterium]|nr:hypothetical protein [Planctomycetota bacterium]MDA1166219.1 hypothetical protein [Planctomycetota bacterium]
MVDRITQALGELLPLIVLMYFSSERKHDAILSLAIPLTPLCRMLVLCVCVFANTADILWRKLFDVPPHVRAVTCRW